MRRVVIPRTGDPTVLRIDHFEELAPGPGEVRIRVAAAGVARADLLMRSGHYPGRTPDLPFTPGWDVAGTVDAIGPGVEARWAGRRVVALTLTGGHATHVRASAGLVVELSETMSEYAAASLALSHVTAYELLHHVAQVRPGERMLVHGASGAVGRALLELGGPAGACPVEVGEAADVVFDPIGGATLRASWRTLRPGGRLVSYGFLGGDSPIPDLLRIRAWNAGPNGRRATFYRLSAAATKHPDRIRAALAAVITDDRLEARVAAKVPLDEAVRAHRLADARPPGRVLLIP